MKRILALALVAGILLTGCNRAKAEAPPPPAKTTVSPPATEKATEEPGQPVKAGVDQQLSDVDGLLNQVDGQLKADGQKVPDED